MTDSRQMTELREIGQYWKDEAKESYKKIKTQNLAITILVATNAFTLAIAIYDILLHWI